MNILEIVLYFRCSSSVVSEGKRTATGDQHTLLCGKVRKETDLSLASCLEKWPFKARPE